MEIFGEDNKCNRLMANIPPLSLGGHSVSLLDNYLVIAASGVTSDGWWYHSLEDPRGGLLANPWKHTKTLGNDAPVNHVSFVYEKDLVLLGGERGTQVALQNGREENGEWNALRLTLKMDGSNFDLFPEDACVVKVAKYTFVVLGGKEASNNERSSKVLLINMKEQNVKEVGSLAFPRAKHACAIIPDSSSSSSTLILVTGGIFDTSIEKDEIYDVAMRTSRTLDSAMNVPRMNHRMVTLGQSIFALGGQRKPSDDSTLDVIEVFDPKSESWSLHTSSLFSKTTKDLAITELPISAVSCNHGCQCGVRSGSRIIGGVEAEVISSQSRIFHLAIF